MIQKLLIILVFSCLYSLNLNAQQQQNLSDIILKYATTGNFSALENLKTLSLKNDEAMMLNALLEQDGNVARAMYERFLVLYPESKLSSISRSRLMEYQTAVSSTQTTLVPKPITEEPASLIPEVRYTLQFGSFASLENAQRFSQKFPGNIQTTILTFRDDYGQVSYKVRWNGYKTTREQIDNLAESIPYDSFVVEHR